MDMENYLAHSLRFMLMVDAVKESVLVRIQKKVTKYIKRGSQMLHLSNYIARHFIHVF